MTLRRRSYDDESAVEAGVDYLLRGFAALTDPPAVAAGVAGGVAPAGATDSYLIAASATSRPEIVEIADFVTDAAADQIEINAAFATTLPSGPTTKNATVILAAGNYSISGVVTIPGFATLTGSGMGSNIEADVAGLEITLDSAGAELAHLSFLSL